MPASSDYVVKDIGLADWGRKEIAIAETEMPGLMATREEFGPEQPLRGARIAGSLHMTIQTAVLIETLQALGAEVRWASCNIYSTQDHAAAAIAAAGTPVFAVKGESLDDYWDYTHRIFEWADGGCRQHDPRRRRRRHAAPPSRHAGGDQSVGHRPPDQRGGGSPLRRDQGAAEGEARLVLDGRRRASAASPRRPPPASSASTRWPKEGRLLFPAINVNDSVTKSKFDNLYGCRESLVDGIRRGTDVMMAGKIAMVCGFGDVGKGSAASLRNAGCRVMVAEIDPICALQAAMEGYEVTTMDDAAPRADIFVTATGNVDVITIDHMRAMKHRAIVCNIGHFDSEIQVARAPELQVAQRQAAGRRDRVPRRQAHHPSVGGPPGQSRQRHGPSELRHVGELHQPDAGADRAVHQARASTSARSTRCRRSSTRRSRGCISPRSASS